MILIAGLGNPGKEYEKTRHNVGFLTVDKLQENCDFFEWETQKKLYAQISSGKIGSEKIIIAKPQAFMNNSGKSIGAISKFYKIKPKNIWIIHDDADLPLETIRISKNKSSAGHRGVESAIKALKTQDFIRFRIGIKTARGGKIPHRPKKEMAKFLVEKKITSAQEEILKKVIKKCVEAVEMTAKEGLNKAMTNFN
ncbi:MAG: aminoacyl-tRNA hydrolase [Syntrophales bacterium]|nr:aminoacyl-tRNA hydrolase [Syntrophales bacterium]